MAAFRLLSARNFVRGILDSRARTPYFKISWRSLRHALPVVCAFRGKLKTALPTMSKISFAAVCSIEKTSFVSAYRLRVSQNIIVSSAITPTRFLIFEGAKAGESMLCSSFQVGPFEAAMFLLSTRGVRYISFSICFGYERSTVT